MAKQINPLFAFYNVVRSPSTTLTPPIPHDVATPDIPTDVGTQRTTIATGDGKMDLPLKTDTTRHGMEFRHTQQSQWATTAYPDVSNVSVTNDVFQSKSTETESGIAGIWTAVGLLLLFLIIRALRWFGRRKRRQNTRTDSQLIQIEEATERANNVCDNSIPAADLEQSRVLPDIPAPNYTLTPSLAEIEDYSLNPVLRPVTPEEEPECVYSTPMVPSMPIMTPNIRVQLLDEILRAKYFQRRTQSTLGTENP